MRLLPLLTLLAGLTSVHLSACEPGKPLRYRLQLIPSEVGGPDTVRRITVGANGCLQVHYPRFDVRAGLWSMMLSENERAGLELRVAALEQAPFDSAALAARKQDVEGQLRRGEARDERPQISVVAGASRHVLELQPGTPQARTLAWTALAHDADRYPELLELTALWQAVEALMALSEDPRLQRMTESLQ